MSVCDRVSECECECGGVCVGGRLLRAREADLAALAGFLVNLAGFLVNSWEINVKPNE